MLESKYDTGAYTEFGKPACEKRLLNDGATQCTARPVEGTPYISKSLQGAGPAVAAELCSDRGWSQ